jgi:WD40 repeat protein/DNA-binding SARP family transcriptional activator
MSSVAVTVLAPFSVAVDGVPVTRFRSARTCALLGLVAASPGALTRSRIAGLLWPDQPEEAAQHNLSQTLLQLRQALGPAGRLALHATRTTLGLDRSVVEVDLDQVRRDLAEARQLQARGDVECATRLREQAVGRYRAPLLDGIAVRGSDTFDSWLDSARAEVRREVVAALGEVVLAVERGGSQPALAAALRWLDLEPLDERALRACMRLLSRVGRTAEALRRFERHRSLLAAELGLVPSPEVAAEAARLRFPQASWEAPPSAPPVGPNPGQRPPEVPDPGPALGREDEAATLRSWAADDSCRVVAVVGLGGTGKTTAVACLARHAGPELVVWRSLVRAPPVHETVAAVLRALSPAPRTDARAGLDGQVDALLVQLRRRRTLLVLDGLDSVLAPDARTGSYSPGQEGYGHLVRRLAGETHPGTLVVTSREVPPDLTSVADECRAVRLLRLGGLSTAAGVALLRARGVSAGPEKTAARVVRHYSGHPLALDAVACTVADLFGGDLEAFVAGGLPVLEEVRDVLHHQLQRLSPVQQEVLVRLAIERVPVTVEHLRSHLLPRPDPNVLIGALRGLTRSCLLERRGHRLTVQHLVAEYVTDLFVEQATREVVDEAPALLGRHAMLCTGGPEHLLRTQERVVVQATCDRLEGLLGREEAVRRVRRIPAVVRERGDPALACAAGNCVNLLRHLEGAVAHLDLHRLPVRSADLRGVRAPGTDLTGADLSGSLFTEDVRALSCLAVSRDGAWMAAGATDGTVLLWDRVAGGPVERVTAHESVVNAVTIDPAATWVAAASTDGTLTVTRLGAGRPHLRVAAHAHGAVGLAAGPGGLLLSSGYDGYLRGWDATTGDVRLELRTPGGSSYGLSVDPGGAVLASADDDGAVRLWSVSTGRLLRTLGTPGAATLAVGFSPDGTLLAGGGFDRTVRLWETSTGRLVAELHGHEHTVSAVAFSPDQRLLATASWDRTVRVWSVSTHRETRVLREHGSYVSGVAFSADGTALASAGYDQTARWTDVDTLSPLSVHRGHTAWVWSLAYVADGSRLVAAHHDHTVRVWDPRAGRVDRELVGHTAEVVGVAVSADGRVVASAANDGSVRLWHRDSGRLLRVLDGPTAALYEVALSADGRLVVAGDLSGTSWVWDAGGGAVRQFRDGQRHSAAPVALARPGGVEGPTLLLAPDGSSAIRLWDAEAGRLLGRLDGHDALVTRLCVAPGDRLLASTGWDGTVRLWDLVRGTPLGVLRGHTAYPMALALSCPGGWVASGAIDGTVRLWDIETGRERRCLAAHAGGVFALAASPDGDTLASGGDDGTVRLWDVATGERLDVLHAPGPYAGLAIAEATGLTHAQRTALVGLGAVDQD